MRQYLQHLSKSFKTFDDSSFNEAMKLISMSNSLVCVGIGNSWHLTEKFASSLAALGKYAISINAAEAKHGGFGRLTSGDTIIIISSTMKSTDIVEFIEHIDNQGIEYRLIVISANADSIFGDVNICTPALDKWMPIYALTWAAIVTDMILHELLDMFSDEDKQKLMARNYPAIGGKL